MDHFFKERDAVTIKKIPAQPDPKKVFIANPPPHPLSQK